MKFFLQTSHKNIVFLLFCTVWSDVILPKEYKSSNLSFWIWCVLLYAWFYFAFRHLSKYSNNAFSLRKYYYSSVFALLFSASLGWGFGIDTNHIGTINFGFWKAICHLFLVITITKTLLELEQKKGINFEAVLTFIMVLFLPIGAWWVHKRIQKVILATQNASSQPTIE